MSHNLRWHFDIPVINPHDPTRVCGVLLPDGVTPPGAMTPDYLKSMHGYNVMIGAYENHTRYLLLPSGVEPCWICDGYGCEHCDRRGYNRTPYD